MLSDAIRGLVPHSTSSCCLEDERKETILAKAYLLRRNLVALERIENQTFGGRELPERMSILGNPSDDAGP